MPCEGMPRRSARIRQWAMRVASLGATELAWRMPSMKDWAVVAGMVMVSLVGWGAVLVDDMAWEEEGCFWGRSIGWVG